MLCTATGLIIDAFGELRDQQEQVKEDMEVSRTAELCMCKNKYKLQKKKKKISKKGSVHFVSTKSDNSYFSTMKICL